MASPNSFFSSSSASKCTVITPRNSPVDEYFQTRSASSLSHSPGEGPFAGWGALPTHLLDSPEPAKLLTFRGTEAIARCNVQAMDDLRKKLRASLSSTPDLDNRDLVSGEPGFDYGSRSNSTNSSYRDVSLGHQSPAGGVLGSLRYSHDQLSSPLSSHTPRNHMEAQQIEVQASRVLKISGIPLEATSLLLFDKLSEFGDIRDIYTKDILPDGFCVVRYFDQGDAIRAFGALHLEEDVGVQYCPEGYLSMLAKISLGGGDDRLELTCVVYSGGWLRRSYRKVFHVLSIFGALCRFANVEGSRPPTFLVCFNNHTQGSGAIDTLDGQYAGGFSLGLAYTNPIYHAAKSRASTTEYQDYSVDNGVKNEVQGLYYPQSLHSESHYTANRDSIASRGSRSMLRFEDDGNPGHPGLKNVLSTRWTPGCNDLRTIRHESGREPAGDIDYGAFQPMNPLALSAVSSLGSQDVEEEAISYYRDAVIQGGDGLPSQLQVPGKNVIDLERIERGLDTRTTVMLRNIPNKVDQQTLKEYVDTTSKAQYNFLYLRIDFRNVCNVGYAFINFIDPLDIIEFVKAKSGTKWNKFNSEKVLDVTYANIQGIDQLVEKFRNSSVMDQDPSYRPKLFHSSGLLIGTEKEFPPANNILKKCRSVSAAQQIGLFAPKMSKGVWRKRD